MLFALELVEETFNQGQIDEKEFRILKKTIDTFVFSLNETNASWVLKPFKS